MSCDSSSSNRLFKTQDTLKGRIITAVLTIVAGLLLGLGISHCDAEQEKYDRQEKSKSE